MATGYMTFLIDAGGVLEASVSTTPGVAIVGMFDPLENRTPIVEQ